MIKSETELRYSSYTEFIEHTHENRHNSLARSWALPRDTEWFHDKSYEDSLKLARSGWKDGRDKTRALLDKLNIVSELDGPTLQFNVVGDGGIDIGRYLSGEPECMFDWQQSPKQSCKIVIDVAASAGIDASRLVKRGAAVIALIEALEVSQVIVEIDAIFYDPRCPMIHVPIKQSGYETQIDQIAYAVAHPAFMRRFCHLALGRGIMPTKHPKPKSLGADIYIPPMHLSEINWNNDTAVTEWIKNMLKAYNVEI